MDRLHHNHGIRTISKLYGLIWDSAPWLILSLIVGQVLQSLCPLIEVWSLDQVIDSLRGSLHSTEPSRVEMGHVLFYVGLMFLALLVSALYTEILPLIREKLEWACIQQIAPNVYKKIHTAPLEEIENPVFNNTISSAMRGLRTLGPTVIDGSGLIGTFLVLLLLFGLIGKYSPLSLLFLIMVTVPHIFFQFKSAVEMNEVHNFRTEDARRVRYIEGLFTSLSVVKEMKVYGFEGTLLSSWQRVYQRIHATETQLGRRRLLTDSLENILFVVGILLCLSLTVWHVRTGTISLGNAVAIFVSVIRVSSFSGKASMLLYRLGANTVDVTSFVSLAESHSLDHERSKIPFPNPLRKGIICDDVYFSYPGQAHPVLESISLHIHPGETVALVGRNGSGKTTLAKILLGLYVPSSGELKYDEIPSQMLGEEEKFRHMKGLFQDFGRYSVALRENIAFGNDNVLEQDDVLLGVLDKLGARRIVDKMKNKLDTPLGFHFEAGQELSGGEWQKVALARAVLTPSVFLVLDEPTAALDPHSEAEVIGQVLQLAEGQTTLIVSHRLGSTKHIGRILVLDCGRIIEEGSHDELIAKKEVYYEMYRAQADWYV